jgi:hypothetical protein
MSLFMVSLEVEDRDEVEVELGEAQKDSHNFQILRHQQWRLVGFIVEEANLNKHSNNKYTIIIIFLNILYRGPQNAYQYIRC